MAPSPPTEPSAIARALGETFPELAPLRVAAILGTGFNSIAVETDTGLVFRVAKTEGTCERYARERRLLAIVRPRLPVDVPEPRWFVERSRQFPFGVVGYAKLEGRTLAPKLLGPHNAEQLAEQVAGLLLALTGVPSAEVEQLGLARAEERPAGYRRLRKETSPALHAHLNGPEFARIDRWWESFLSDERMLRYRPVLAHGDLWFENMLVDSTAERLTGIVDWEHAAIADPALDFSTVLHLGEPFTASVVEAYRRGGGAFGAEDSYRMRRLWELRHFYGVLFGVRFHDEAELADSVAKLRAGPLFDGS